MNATLTRPSATAGMDRYTVRCDKGGRVIHARVHALTCSEAEKQLEPMRLAGYAVAAFRGWYAD
jgi:hypothetical protein